MDFSSDRSIYSKRFRTFQTVSIENIFKYFAKRLTNVGASVLLLSISGLPDVTFSLRSESFVDRNDISLFSAYKPSYIIEYFIDFLGTRHRPTLTARCTSGFISFKIKKKPNELQDSLKNVVICTFD